MKRIISTLLMFTLILSLCACGNTSEHSGEAKTPSGSSVQKGRNYLDVMDDFEEKGFTNIELVALDDLITGFMVKDGEVESVSVDGDENYSADRWYIKDVQVIITYHTFSNNSDSTENKTLADSDDNVKLNEPSKSDSEEVVLTVDNCEDLKNILLLDSELNPEYTKFAEKYSGKTIEFDGCIVYIDNHANYDTRYDILFMAGDYIDEDTVNSGPIFKFNDVGLSNLGIKDLYLPDFVRVGVNIRVTAEVNLFDENAGVLILNPILIEER